MTHHRKDPKTNTGVQTTDQHTHIMCKHKVSSHHQQALHAPNLHKDRRSIVIQTRQAQELMTKGKLGTYAHTTTAHRIEFK